MDKWKLSRHLAYWLWSISLCMVNLTYIYIYYGLGYIKFYMCISIYWEGQCHLFGSVMEMKKYKWKGGAGGGGVMHYIEWQRAKLKASPKSNHIYLLGSFERSLFFKASHNCNKRERTNYLFVLSLFMDNYWYIIISKSGYLTSSLIIFIKTLSGATMNYINSHIEIHTLEFVNE